MDFDVSVVINQAQFSKFVLKKAHAGARRADHFRECLLADVGDDWLGSPLSIAADDYEESLPGMRRHIKEGLKVAKVAA